MQDRLGLDKPADTSDEPLRQCLRLQLLDAVDPDGPRDVLYPAFASVLERKVGLAFKLVADTACDVYPARFVKTLQASRDIDAVAIDVLVIDDYVAGIDADAELDPAICRDAGIVLGQFALDIETAAHRVHRAVELDQKTVARGADQPAMVLGDFGLEQIFDMSGEAKVCALFIDPHQPGIADDIRHQNGGEPASQVCVSHANHLNSLSIINFTIKALFCHGSR